MCEYTYVHKRRGKLGPGESEGNQQRQLQQCDMIGEEAWRMKNPNYRGVVVLAVSAMCLQQPTAPEVPIS